MDGDFVEGISEGGVSCRDFEETLVVHDENEANIAGFDNWGEEVRNIDRTGAFFEEEMGIIEAENDVFGRVNFIEDFDHEVFEFAAIFGGGDEAGSIEGLNLAVFEVARDFRIGVHESFGKGVDDGGAARTVGAD